MPVSAPTSTDQPSPSRRLARLLAGLLAFAMLVPASAGPAAQPVAAGGSCTGWQSRTHPPETIRVGRADGSVDVVDFRRYVVVVTAKEWPNYLPSAAIEAGATAVKQYAWSKTLAGNHRPSYFNAAGKCYDVVDSTRDQLYKPETANVTSKIKRAVDRTWGLSLRKSGRFFLTGYRTGTSTRCGSDADGYRLYARSVVDCARRGMSRQQIQFRYYGRDLTLHWTDGRVISFRSASSDSSTPKPKPAPKPRPAPEPAPEPAPASTFFLNLPQLTGEPATDPASVLAWLPAAPASAGGGDLGATLSMPTVYSLPGTLLQLPSTQAALERNPWLAVCATGIGALPVGETSYLAAMPPPFGCADASVGGAGAGQPPPVSVVEPIVARVYVDAGRAWVIY